MNKGTFKKIDRVFNILANWLVIVALILTLWMLCHKSVTGEQQMYIDYYNKINK